MVQFADWFTQPPEFEDVASDLAQNRDRVLTFEDVQKELPSLLARRIPSPLIESFAAEVLADRSGWLDRYLRFVTVAATHLSDNLHSLGAGAPLHDAGLCREGLRQCVRDGRAAADLLIETNGALGTEGLQITQGDLYVLRDLLRIGQSIAALYLLSQRELYAHLDSLEGG